MRIIDLSVPVTPGHLRWPAELSVKGDTTAGDLFQVTTLRLTCHGFTHVDARRHYFGDGATIEATPLDEIVGEAAVIDLMDVMPNQEIGAALLEHRMAHVKENERIILKTGWHRHRDIGEANFWLDAPYLSREAALYLKSRAIRMIGYDFPQDFCIRLLLKGEVRPIEEHVTHDILLRAGVTMVEYLTNTAAITKPRVQFHAAPLKLPGADGSPTRAYAIEE